MACRDYEFDYETWLRRGLEHLNQMMLMLRQLRRAAEKVGLEIPAPVAQWFEDDVLGKTGSLNRENFDRAAQNLCMLCRAAEAKGVTLPTSIMPWWTEHKTRDQHACELEKGLSPTPIYADFWAEHEARMALLREVTGIPHLDAVRALEKAGLRVVRRGKVIAMTTGELEILIPRQDPVNGFAMAGILNRIRLSEEVFRKLL